MTQRELLKEMECALHLQNVVDERKTVVLKSEWKGKAEIRTAELKKLNVRYDALMAIYNDAKREFNELQK